MSDKNKESESMNLPNTGFVRLNTVLKNHIPISRTAWYEGVKKGLYPQPIKLGTHIAVYRVEDIRALIAKLGEGK